MPNYAPTAWSDRSVQKPRTYTITNNGDGTNTLAAAEGTIYNAGTAISAAAMNNIEQGVASIIDASFCNAMGGMGL